MISIKDGKCEMSGNARQLEMEIRSITYAYYLALSDRHGDSYALAKIAELSLQTLEDMTDGNFEAVRFK